MQSYQTLAKRRRQSLMLSLGWARIEGEKIPVAQNCGHSLGFQAGQTLYLSLVLACHFFEIRNSRGKQIDMEPINLPYEKTKN
jgi:hypothetical protein